MVVIIGNEGYRVWGQHMDGGYGCYEVHFINIES